MDVVVKDALFVLVCCSLEIGETEVAVDDVVVDVVVVVELVWFVTAVLSDSDPFERFSREQGNGCNRNNKA